MGPGCEKSGLTFQLHAAGGLEAARMACIAQRLVCGTDRRTVAPLLAAMARSTRQPVVRLPAFQTANRCRAKAVVRKMGNPVQGRQPGAA